MNYLVQIYDFNFFVPLFRWRWWVAVAISVRSIQEFEENVFEIKKASSFCFQCKFTDRMWENKLIQYQTTWVFDDISILICFYFNLFNFPHISDLTWKYRNRPKKKCAFNEFFAWFFFNIQTKFRCFQGMEKWVCFPLYLHDTTFCHYNSTITSNFTLTFEAKFFWRNKQ